MLVACGLGGAHPVERLGASDLGMLGLQVFTDLHGPGLGVFILCPNRGQCFSVRLTLRLGRSLHAWWLTDKSVGQVDAARNIRWSQSGVNRQTPIIGLTMDESTAMRMGSIGVDDVRLLLITSGYPRCRVPR